MSSTFVKFGTKVGTCRIASFSSDNVADASVCFLAFVSRSKIAQKVDHARAFAFAATFVVATRRGTFKGVFILSLLTVLHYTRKNRLQRQTEKALFCGKRILYLERNNEKFFRALEKTR